ncbi:MAG: hypothetical protein DDT19_02905 [Syntrophomonadaceae bacterium]|nr:hypothetical protein [Bacillota bacterium]
MALVLDAGKFGSPNPLCYILHIEKLVGPCGKSTSYFCNIPKPNQLPFALLQDGKENVWSSQVLSTPLVADIPTTLKLAFEERAVLVFGILPALFQKVLLLYGVDPEFRGVKNPGEERGLIRAVHLNLDQIFAVQNLFKGFFEHDKFGRVGESRPFVLTSLLFLRSTKESNNGIHISVLKTALSLIIIDGFDGNVLEQEFLKISAIAHIQPGVRSNEAKDSLLIQKRKSVKIEIDVVVTFSVNVLD